MTSSRRPLFDSVLCPVDFSTHSRRALEYAALVARRSGGSLSALFVNDPLLVAAAAAAYDKRALASQSRIELERFIRQTLKSDAAARRVATFVTLGNPAREIIKAARKLGTGLIVLGSEGLSGAPKLFFGSTTSRVLAQAAIPVLAIPPAGKRPVKSGWPGRRILAALSLGRRPARDVTLSAGVAAWFGASLSLAHIVEHTRLPGWLARQAGSDRARVERATAQLERLAARIGSAGSVDVHVRVGEPASQIASLATDLDAGLVVVTLRKAPGLFGARQGSITYRVVQEAGTPVLALPAAWHPHGPQRG
jgi:nucleotide-binding universal stress UspA family protein